MLITRFLAEEKNLLLWAHLLGRYALRVRVALQGVQLLEHVLRAETHRSRLISQALLRSKCEKTSWPCEVSEPGIFECYKYHERLMNLRSLMSSRYDSGKIIKLESSTFTGINFKLASATPSDCVSQSLRNPTKMRVIGGAMFSKSYNYLNDSPTHFCWPYSGRTECDVRSAASDSRSSGSSMRRRGSCKRSKIRKQVETPFESIVLVLHVRRKASNFVLAHCAMSPKCGSNRPGIHSTLLLATVTNLTQCNNYRSSTYPNPAIAYRVLLAVAQMQREEVRLGGEHVAAN